jgi:hypothetical protein
MIRGNFSTVLNTVFATIRHSNIEGSQVSLNIYIIVGIISLINEILIKK